MIRLRKTRMHLEICVAIPVACSSRVEVKMTALRGWVKVVNMVLGG
jgi:hypothetical protein